MKFARGSIYFSLPLTITEIVAAWVWQHTFCRLVSGYGPLESSRLPWRTSLVDVCPFSACTLLLAASRVFVPTSSFLLKMTAEFLVEMPAIVERSHSTFTFLGTRHACTAQYLNWWGEISTLRDFFRILISSRTALWRHMLHTNSDCACVQAEQ